MIVLGAGPVIYLIARTVRSAVLGERQADYVAAARLRGVLLKPFPKGRIQRLVL